MFNEPYLTIGINNVVSLSEKTLWVLGRDESNEIHLKDAAASRKHAQITLNQKGGLVISDLGSRNGTFVNKRRVTKPTVLRSGDEIIIGHTTVKFTDPDYYGTTTDLGELDKTQIIHERKLITVLVVDIKGYTQLTQRTDEILLARLISTWSTFCGDQVQTYGGWTHKFIGDAMMAVWLHDAPPIDRDIKKILLCLSKICKFTSALHKQFGLNKEIKIGAGVNTGYGMVGNNGSSSNPDFTPIGDAVNAAFRYESATRTVDSELLIGESTYSYFTQKPTLRKFSLELKGYDELKTVFGCNFEELHQLMFQK